jgi:excisionase family DNA binding protein
MIATPNRHGFTNRLATATATVATRPESLLINEREAADMLRCSPRTVFQLRKDGQLPFVIVGKSGVRYRRADIERFIERNLKTNVAEVE